MATFTPQKGYSLPVVGADLNIWGTELNNGFTVLDNNMGGSTTVAFTNTNVTATSLQAQFLIQNLTGTLTGDVTYILPALGSFYFVENNTTGAFAMNIASSGGGATVGIPQGAGIWLVCDGTNMFSASLPIITNSVTVNVGGNTNVTASPSQAANLIQTLTGILTGPIQYILPSTSALYIINNETTGPFALTIASVGGGTSVIVPQGGNTMMVFCDGTNIIPANSAYPSGEAFVNVGGAANVTATAAQAQYLVQTLTGVLTGNIQYILPLTQRMYSIFNGTTGNFTLTIASTAGGTTPVPVPQGTQAMVYCDATGNIFPLATSVPASSISINVGGSSTVNATAAQAAYLIQNLTGALTGNIAYIVPARVGFFCVKNGTTGNFSVTVQSAGAGKVVPVAQGLDAWLWTDGTNIFPANPGWTEISRVTVNGAVSMTLLLPTSFARFKITWQGAGVSATNQLFMRVSINGGSSFITGNVYVYTAFGFSTAGGNVVSINTSTTDTSFPIGAQAAGSTGTAMDGTTEIWPGNGSFGTIIRGNNFVLTTNTGFQQTYTAGTVAAGGVNAVAILVPTGTFSGTFIVEGLP